MHVIKDKEPEFCIITPVAYLRHTKWTSSHLLLAHLVNDSDEYAAFYKERSIAGDFLMMDNSAYELKVPYDADKLVELGQKCGAHAIVLPDYPFQPSSVTVEAAEKLIPHIKAAGFKTFFVPQSEPGDLGDWINSYNWAANNPDIDIIGMSILGVPNALPNIHYAYSRVVMTQKLIDAGYFNFNKHHHYLGLNAGPGLEIPSLLKMKALDTIDSSGPVWAGITGHQYSIDTDSLQATSKIKMPVDFNLPYSKDAETQARIVHNITLTLDIFEADYHKNKTWYAEE